MDEQIHAGDVVVCRVNGTYDQYVIGTVVSGTAGHLMLRDTLTTNGRDRAISRGYTQRKDNRRVWLFDGSAAAYVRTPEPKRREDEAVEEHRSR